MSGQLRVSYSVGVKQEVKELFGEKENYGLALSGSCELAIVLRKAIRQYDRLSFEDTVSRATSKDSEDFISRLRCLRELLPQVCNEIRTQLDADDLVDMLESL